MSWLWVSFGDGGFGGQSSRLVFWALPKRLKEPPAEPPIVTGLAKRVSHTREASVEITGTGIDLSGGNLGGIEPPRGN